MDNCKLTHMFEMQGKLNDNVIEKKGMTHYNVVCRDKGKNRREWADDFMSCLTAEVAETREALTQRVKWWKDKTKDRDGVLDEMVDCWHFLMSGVMAMGFTPEEFYQMYLKKNAHNFERKDWDVNQESKTDSNSVQSSTGVS